MIKLVLDRFGEVTWPCICHSSVYLSLRLCLFIMFVYCSWYCIRPDSYAARHANVAGPLMSHWPK